MLISFQKRLNKLKPKSKILIIAGSDSSGGAGIQADIKTVTALGSYAMTAITAITAQNTTGVKSIASVEPKEISNQIEFTANDIRPDAIKIGMLHSSEVINSVLRSLDLVKVKKSIKIAEKLMKGQGRILVRKSGTEFKIRVMGESENKELLNKCIKIITKKIK